VHIRAPFRLKTREEAAMFRRRLAAKTVSGNQPNRDGAPVAVIDGKNLW
jgi:hypothetical protein